MITYSREHYRYDGTCDLVLCPPLSGETTNQMPQVPGASCPCNAGFHAEFEEDPKGAVSGFDNTTNLTAGSRDIPTNALLYDESIQAYRGHCVRDEDAAMLHTFVSIETVVHCP